MYKMTFFIMSLMSSMITLSQNSPIPDTSINLKVHDTVNSNKIFEKVEVEASFPGGESSWLRYISKNIKFDVPIKKGAPDGMYTVMVKFIVSEDGSISNVIAETNLGYGMEEEAIRIIQKSPKWSPALLNGKAVIAYRRQPLAFFISE